FWLAKMNDFSRAGENVRDEGVALARVRRAEMVRAFIESIEYRRRFQGSPTGNQEGSSVIGEEGTADAGFRPWPELARAAPTPIDSLLRRFWLSD
ncbi:MAG TPA: hypothetical protein VF736_05175, partial [Pyrinomonadaceae bacterium]